MVVVAEQGDRGVAQDRVLIQWIIDDNGTHKAPRTKRRLARNLRLSARLTPYSGS